MAARNLEQHVVPTELPSNDCSNLKNILLRYHGVVHNLAFHLTNDEITAEEVAIEVFTRFSQERHKFTEEPLDSLIHRFTYDAALPKLLELIEKHTEEVDVFGLEVGDRENTLIC